MNKVSIEEQLRANSTAITDFILSLSEDELNQKIDEKWSVAENAIHLVKSVAPINIALNLPKLAFLVFGKSKSNRSYDEIVALYQSKLTGGAKASKPYEPKSGKTGRTSSLTKSFTDNYDTLINKLEDWSEDDLDNYRLPHPILGKLTIREMLFFTIFHMDYHLKSMQKLHK